MTTLERLLSGRDWNAAAIEALLALSDPAGQEALRKAAFARTEAELGDLVHYRGLIEISNICACDCLYCGIRRGNHAVSRYAMTKEAVVESAIWAAEAGYGSCVLQAGERRDEAFAAFVADCVAEIKARTTGPALPCGLGITLSFGEQTPETYRRWKEAGAHRYLLRIETTNPALFATIHPASQTFANRLNALADLREAGFQVGTGVMIGLPGQTLADLAADILFFKAHDIDMIGMGPYITAPGSAMAERGMMEKGALLALALRMIAATRLVLGDVNIAATTALQALVEDGREQGIAHGANVVMPNLTPRTHRGDYQLYDGKPCIEEARDDCRLCLERRVVFAGRKVGWNDWGDSPHYARRG